MRSSSSLPRPKVQLVCLSRTAEKKREESPLRWLRAAKGLRIESRMSWRTASSLSKNGRTKWKFWRTCWGQSKTRWKSRIWSWEGSESGLQPLNPTSLSMRRDSCPLFPSSQRLLSRVKLGLWSSKRGRIEILRMTRSLIKNQSKQSRGWLRLRWNMKKLLNEDQITTKNR